MKQIFTIFLVVAFGVLGWGQVEITGSGPFTIDFAGFTGAGFAPSPSSGQLNSNTWRVRGLQDGNGSFGGTHTSGDFALGSSSGGVGQGGIYAFTLSGGPTLGIQPTGNDFTPGDFTLRLINKTGEVLTGLDLSYTFYVRNDQDRANSFNFSYSEDDAAYTDVSALDYTSPAARSGSAWIPVFRSTSITGLNVADNGFIYLQWYSDDVSGGGSRDEFGLGNITISEAFFPITLSTFTARSTGSSVQLDWRTATELNNDYMEVEHSTDGRNYRKIGTVQGAGTTQEEQAYSFLHESPAAGLNYYRLLQVDYDGAYEYHGPVSVRMSGGDKLGGALSLFPTVASEAVQVQYEGQLSNEAELQVIGMDGRVWRTQRWEAKSASLALPVEDLPAGMYLLRLQVGRDVEVARFVKQ